MEALIIIGRGRSLVLRKRTALVWFYYSQSFLFVFISYYWVRRLCSSWVRNPSSSRPNGSLDGPFLCIWAFLFFSSFFLASCFIFILCFSLPASLVPDDFLAGCFIVNLLLLANVDDHRPISLRAAIFLLLSFSSSSSLPSFPSPLPSSASSLFSSTSSASV